MCVCGGHQPFLTHRRLRSNWAGAVWAHCHFVILLLCFDWLFGRIGSVCYLFRCVFSATNVVATLPATPVKHNEFGQLGQSQIGGFPHNNHFWYTFVSLSLVSGADSVGLSHSDSLPTASFEHPSCLLTFPNGHVRGVPVAEGASQAPQGCTAKALCQQMYSGITS